MMDEKQAPPTTAYLHGWDDGRYGEPRCFTDNQSLTSMQAPSDRLDYYRGHRAGRETRLHEDTTLEAS